MMRLLLSIVAAALLLGIHAVSAASLRHAADLPDTRAAHNATQLPGGRDLLVSGNVAGIPVRRGSWIFDTSDAASPRRAMASSSTTETPC